MKKGHKGLTSKQERHRRDWLVRSGRASWWFPLKTLDNAIAAAGL